MLADIITIGDEILLGQTIDTNSAWMAQKLIDEGIGIRQITSIQDTPKVIRQTVEEAMSISGLVLVTGGLGPTRDDVTKQTLADLFGMSLQKHPETLRAIEAFFSRRNRPMLEVNRKQAWLPEGCVILPNPIGTAAGMWFNHSRGVVVSLPGVPYEMKGLMENEVIPRLRGHFETPARYHRTLVTAGIGESFLSEQLGVWESRLAERDVSIAYLPSPGKVRVRLSAVDWDADQARMRVEAEVAQFRELAKKWLVSDRDEPLAAALGRRLAAKGQTLATAESCTGGGIGAAITAIPGSSGYFVGGIMAYANSAKVDLLSVSMEELKEHGAVSDAVARAMAEGARMTLRSDWALATTGVAGPGGGSEEKPVGTVWIACAGPTGTQSKRFQFAGNRERNIRQTILAALDMLRKAMDESPD
ncbi:MAG: competence/damage-inducible protein A [Flavobacteriales bacterium]